MMSERITVVGLGDSLAPASKSLAAMKIALDAAVAARADVELFDIRALDLLFFRPGMGQASAAARRWAEAAVKRLDISGAARSIMGRSVVRSRTPWTGCRS
jgi:hypothetical protein